MCTLTGSNIIISSTSSKADDDHPIPHLATSDTLLGTLNGRPGRDTPLNDHDFGFPHRFFAGPFSKNVTFTSPNATLPIKSNTKTSVKQMTSIRGSNLRGAALVQTLALYITNPKNSRCEEAHLQLEIQKNLS